MSKVSGEKARAAIQKRNRTAQRVKDRAKLAEIKAGGEKPAAAKAGEKAPRQPNK